MPKHITYTKLEDVASFKQRRNDETHVADIIKLPNAQLSLQENLLNAKSDGIKFVIVGIPEDIGPRANCGNGGAKNAWHHYLPVLLNQQANQFFDWSSVMLLGNIDVDDLQKQSNVATISDHKLDSLRQLCGILDQRVQSILEPLFKHGFNIVVIGGGHNNAYPIIKSLFSASNQKVGAVNLDPHADFRLQEGRHSGNPFRYAYAESALSHYCVLGLHEQKNNSSTIQGLLDAKFPFITYQQLFTQLSITFKDAVLQAKEYIEQNEGFNGIELDMDSIKQMPASAFSSTGFSSEQAMFYVNQLAQSDKARYLHLCEAAPDANEPPNHKALESAQVLVQLTYSYLIGQQ